MTLVVVFLVGVRRVTRASKPDTVTLRTVARFGALFLLLYGVNAVVGVMHVGIDAVTVLVVATSTRLIMMLLLVPRS